MAISSPPKLPVLGVLVVLAMNMAGCGSGGGTPGPKPFSTADLVVQPRTLTMKGHINSIAFSGRVHPGIPSYARPYTRNRITVKLPKSLEQAGPTSITLRGIMPGMRMTPFFTTLLPSGRHRDLFTGVVRRIPMFGWYTFRVNLAARRHSETGKAELLVPLS